MIPSVVHHASIQTTNIGQWSIHVEHVVAGVTPTMLCWFLSNRDNARYRRWHPAHESFETLSRPAHGVVGSVYRVREAIGPHPAVTLRLRVEQADEHAFVERSLGVTKPARFGHRFQAVADGTMIESFYLIGSDLPVLGPIANAVMRRFVFPRERCEDIVAHCVDEFSRMTDFLPTMYTHCRTAAVAA